MKKEQPQIGDRRVVVCEHTFKEVVQEYVNNNHNEEQCEWLCQHGDTDEEDAEEVKKFREKEKEQ